MDLDIFLKNIDTFLWLNEVDILEELIFIKLKAVK